MGWLDRPQLDAFHSAQTILAMRRWRSMWRGPGIVLLKNDKNLLPLDRAKIKTIVVVGPNADPAVSGGGGSSHTRAVPRSERA